MKGPLSYVGGKSRLAATIIDQIPPHKTYVEPFSGGAQVLFRKKPSDVEVINDLDGELINFYRVCQAHYEELIRYMRFVLISREWFVKLQKTPTEALTDIQRAARYFQLQKTSYGGRVLGQTYGIHVVQHPNFSAKRARLLIEQTHDRLERVQIEHLPYEQVVERYDRPSTFFYLDPPYYDVRFYRYNFKRADFEALAARLRALKGKFLMSINDHPAVRELFADFTIDPVQITYSLHTGQSKTSQELLIKNY